MDDSIHLGVIEEDGRQERSDAAANRALLLETAARLFALHGVSDVTMADIARDAGVGKGTLYRRFSNKGELCLSLMDSQLQTFQNQVLEELQQMTEEGVPKLAQLAHFLEQLVYFTDRHMPLLCEVQQQSQDLDESELVRPHFWQYMTVDGLLQEAKATGELPAGVDDAVLAEALLAPLGAQQFRFQRERRGFTLERISAGLRSLVMALRREEDG